MHYEVCDFALDIVQNSVEAGARTIVVEIATGCGRVGIRVEDDGCGMTEDELRRAVDPFFTDGKKHAGRKVGLGIPFLLQSLEQAGGSHELRSKKGEGTVFAFEFPADSIDTPPLGDVAGFFLSALSFDGGYELAARRLRDGAEAYAFKRSELADAVGDLHDAASLASIREFLVSCELGD